MNAPAASFSRHDLQLIQGALDSLGVALADCGHQWTDGERAIYEDATALLAGAISAAAARLGAEMSQKPIIIEWNDSLQPVTGWHMMDDLPTLDVAKCKTVGWLVAENDSALMVAQNIADPESAQMQAGGLMRIPKCCVTSCADLFSRPETARKRRASESALLSASSLLKGLSRQWWIPVAMFVFSAWCVGETRRLP